MTVMSSYNLINHTYAPNSRDLLTDILRCEWGFSGLVMSDWGSCDEGEVLYDGKQGVERRGDAAACVTAGNDLVMPGSQQDADEIIEAAEHPKAGAMALEELRASAERIIRTAMITQAEE